MRVERGFRGWIAECSLGGGWVVTGWKLGREGVCGIFQAGQRQIRIFSSMVGYLRVRCFMWHDIKRFRSEK